MHFQKFLLLASALQLLEGAVATDLEKRVTVNDPAIGIELECRQIELTNPNTALHDDYALSARVKGKPFVFPNLQNHQDWQLTAETLDDNVKRLTAEIVVSGPDGKGVAISHTSTVGATVGSQIETWLHSLRPRAGVTAHVQGFTNLGTWTIETPANDMTDSLVWGAQVTAPYPLAGLNQILGREREDASALVFQSKANWYEIVRECHLGYAGTHDKPSFEEDEDVLGFFTLLMGYIKAAKIGTNAEAGPKHSSPVMPRTDFRTIYHSIKSKTDAWIHKVQAGDYNTQGQHVYQGYHTHITDFYSLTEQVCYSIKLCSSTATFANMEFTWNDWHHGGSRKVSVREWIRDLGSATATGLDEVSQADRNYQAGQIGGLESKMERIIGGTKALPIFEFRDIPGITAPRMAANLRMFENAVKSGHSKYGSGLLRKRATTSKTSKTKKKCPLIKERCSNGQTLQTTKDPKTGKTVQKCACAHGQVSTKTKDPKTGKITEKCACPATQTLTKSKDAKTGKTVQKCGCAKGKTLKAGKCVASNTCTGGMTMQSTKDATGKVTKKCACPKNTVFRSGKCQKAATKCPKGAVLKAGKCQKASCPSGSVMKGTKCMKIKCPAGAVSKGSRCVKVKCPTGAVLKGNRCTRVKCPAKSVLKGTKCVKVKCPAGATLSASGKCQKKTCPKGTTMKGAKCYRKKPAVKKCPAGSKKSGGRCVSTRKNKKSKCMKIKNLKKKAACEAASGAVGLLS